MTQGTEAPSGVAAGPDPRHKVWQGTEATAQPAEPTDGASLGYYIGGPYHDGTYAVCETASGRVIRKFREEEDLLEEQCYKWSYCGMERFRVFAAGDEDETASLPEATAQAPASPSSAHPAGPALVPSGGGQKSSGA